MKSIRSAKVQAVRADTKLRKLLDTATVDSFQNFAAKLGIGSDNLNTAATYGFNPVTRQRTLLEWIHRGTWLGGVAIDIVADDMTRAGVELQGRLKPDAMKRMETRITSLGVWNQLNRVVRWARLYGGCLGVLLIDGQDVSTSLRPERIGKDQFKGILPLDRWMCEPMLNNMIEDFGPHLGLPKYYYVTSHAPAFTGKKIHYSRCIRLIGVELPYTQAMIENFWGLSVIERLYDRMVAFDSATTGAAQLVHKAYLRTYKIENFREIVSTGGEASLRGLMNTIDMMRRFQMAEGMTLMDKNDEFEGTVSNPFSGLSDALIQFGQQLGGALQIPLVRLFGQSPAGMNSTGESDLRMYYDGILQQQVSTLLTGVTTVYRAAALSEGIKLSDDFGIKFRNLWQMQDKEKAEIAASATSTVQQAEEAGLVTRKTALMELKQSSNVTGIWSNISDEDISEAESDGPPLPLEIEVQQLKTEATERAAQAKADSEGDEEDASPAGKRKAKDAEVAECFGCGRLLKNTFRFPVQTSSGKRVIVGPECNAPIKAAGAQGWKSPKGEILYNHIVIRDNATRLAWYHDLQVVIENPAGTHRRGYGFDAILPADYGYIRRSEGADGDELDCFVGPSPESPHVFVIDQKNLSTGNFDEHKVMLGYYTRECAIEDYVLAHTDGKGPARMMKVSAVDVGEFKQWLTKGDATKPFGMQLVNGGVQ